MSVIRPRNRLVYCRVSEDEFAKVSNLCESVGARSVSDLFRLALTRMLNEESSGRDELLLQRLGDIDKIMRELSGRLGDLTTQLNGMMTETSENVASVPRVLSTKEQR